MRSLGTQVLEAGTVAEARSLLSQPPGVLIVDVRLPDAPVFALLEEIVRLWPRPVVVAISGRASAEEAFRLARYGVRIYLEKPLSLDQLGEAVESACRGAGSTDSVLLDFLVSVCVGAVSLREMQDSVRHAMIRQALALSQGSRAGAARLLDVSRQAVQQMLRSGTAAYDEARAREGPPGSKTRPPDPEPGD